MPITDYRFENGVFYCREVGRIEEEDAHKWVHYARHYSEMSDHPIVAVIDAREAKYITAAARRVFARGSGIMKLHDAAVVTADFLVEQNARLINMMAVDKHTRIFHSIEEATLFARERSNWLRRDDAQI